MVTVTVITAINAHFNIYLVELPTSASESIVEVTKLQNTTLEPSEVAMSQSLDTSCTKPSGMLSSFQMSSYDILSIMNLPRTAMLSTHRFIFVSISLEQG